MSQFTPGLELSRLFFEDAVKPILRRTTPGLVYGAALIGSGSEALGFDDEMSTDHHWGPRVILFLNESDFDDARGVIDAAMRESLPRAIRGYPTNFSDPDPNDNNVRRLVEVEKALSITASRYIRFAGI